FVMLVRHEMDQRREQKRAKPAAGRVGVLNSLLLEHASEKGLSQILRVLRTVPAAPKECVQRIPVRLAQSRQCFASIPTGGARACCEHHAPSRGGEVVPPWSVGHGLSITSRFG